jgi:hypothetical protein
MARRELLYIREDLVHQYVDDRSFIWFAFGERELLPYPPSPPQWLKPFVSSMRTRGARCLLKQTSSIWMDCHGITGETKTQPGVAK